MGVAVGAVAVLSSCDHPSSTTAPSQRRRWLQSPHQLSSRNFRRQEPPDPNPICPEAPRRTALLLLCAPALVAFLASPRRAASSSIGINAHSMADRAAGRGRRHRPVQDPQDANPPLLTQDYPGYALDAATPLKAVQHILWIKLLLLTCHPLLAMLQHAGLEMLQYIMNARFDILMLTALVERWSPMINTFYMTVSEMTVTLHDVAVILGCRIDGPTLIGPTMVGAGSRWESWPACCMELLGAIPIPDHTYENPFRPVQTSTFRMGQAQSQSCLPLRWLL